MALDDFAAVESALSSIRIALEMRVRQVLGVTGRAETKHLIERLENERGREVADRARELTRLGNAALHKEFPSYLRDLQRAWEIVLGDGSSAGLFDSLSR